MIERNHNTSNLQENDKSWNCYFWKTNRVPTGLHPMDPRLITPPEPERPILRHPDCTIRTMSFISHFNLDRQKISDMRRYKRRLQKILALLQHLKKLSEIITITIIFIMSSHQSCFETVFYYKKCKTHVWNKRVTLLLLWDIMIKVFSFIVTV